ncbi:MAG: hypothetical protein VKS61_00215, partial [Candidatus Sericytochromatia bacterium]|nr:hypothetical protein [Candidatus Sericytochromatia bacterium]
MPPSELMTLVQAGEAGLCPGFVAGMRELAWATPLRWQGAPPPRASLEALSRVLAGALPGADAPPPWPVAPGEAAVRWLGHWTRELLREAGLPVFGPAEVLPPAGGEAGPWWLLIPAHGPTAGATAEAFAWTCTLLAPASGGGAPDEVLTGLAALLGRLRSLAPQGANTVPLLRAAYEAGIPTCHVAGGVYQIGQGALARLLKSTFTDQTPAIGAEWARDKRLAAAVLRRAGLPTPAHRL